MKEMYGEGTLLPLPTTRTHELQVSQIQRWAPKVRQVVEDLPKLEPVDDDEEDENVRKISFSTMDF